MTHIYIKCGSGRSLRLTQRTQGFALASLLLRHGSAAALRVLAQMISENSKRRGR